MELRYRLAVVTGAGSGLGREIAVALSRQGAGVLVVDRDLDAARAVAAEVAEARVRGWALAADVTDDSDLRLVAGRARDLGVPTCWSTTPAAGRPARSSGPVRHRRSGRGRST